MNELEPFEFGEMSNKLIRTNLTEYHYDKLIAIIKEAGEEELLKALEERKSIVERIYPNKITAAEKATELRTAKAKKNIKLALEYLTRENKKVTQQAIAEISKCSVNTVRKYNNIWKK